MMKALVSNGLRSQLQQYRSNNIDEFFKGGIYTAFFISQVDIFLLSNIICTSDIGPQI